MSKQLATTHLKRADAKADLNEDIYDILRFDADFCFDTATNQRKTQLAFQAWSADQVFTQLEAINWWDTTGEDKDSVRYSDHAITPLLAQLLVTDGKDDLLVAKIRDGLKKNIIAYYEGQLKRKIEETRERVDLEANEPDFEEELKIGGTL
ncbi:hypothetical protein [uncultured Mediterranean phage uvMED]|nr:hypothetical protein [uncultured Mediterranean phage uvMED]